MDATLESTAEEDEQAYWNPQGGVPLDLRALVARHIQMDDPPADPPPSEPQPRRPLPRIVRNAPSAHRTMELHDQDVGYTLTIVDPTD